MTPSNRVVLVVDDGDNDRKLFRFATGDAKWVSQIVELENGHEVIEYLGRSVGELPALIVLDLKMPGSDGFEVLQWLRTRREWDTVPVVVLTSSNEEVDRRQAMSLGATEYQVKPTTYAELVRLARDMQRKWLEREWPQVASPAAERDGFPRKGKRSG